MMMLGVTSLMPGDEGCLHVGGVEANASPTGNPSSSLSLGLQFGPLLTMTKTEDRLPASLLAMSGGGRLTTAARRRPSPPLDDLNTPATFTPTYSCGHFVFDGVGEFALTTVDDLPTNGDGLDNGSATAACSSVQKSAMGDNSSSGGGGGSGQSTATLADLCRPPTLTALPLLQPTAVISCSDVTSQQPCDLTLSTAEPTTATDLVPSTVAAERPVTLTSALEESTLSLLGGLLPFQQQQQQQNSSPSLLTALSTCHAATDVLDNPNTTRSAGMQSPRYGVVVTGLPASTRPWSKPATSLVDDRRFFSPLIVHRAVTGPYPIPLGVVGAHAGCFIEPQRCWWPPPPPPPPPTSSSSSSSLQSVTPLTEICGNDSTASTVLQRLIADVSSSSSVSPTAEKLEDKTAPQVTAPPRRCSRRDRVSPVGAGPAVKAFSCPVPDCGRSFSRSDELARHGRVHSGERPFSCSVCSRAFSRRDHLSTHVRTHTGEKPYTCEVCARSFARSDERNRHRRVHGKAATDSRRPPTQRYREQTCAGL